MGVVETCQLMMTKCVLEMVGNEAKEACGVDQLCREMEAIIEGGINGVCLLWYQHAQEEDWVFLIIDAQNVFNEENRTAMLWVV